MAVTITLRSNAPLSQTEFRDLGDLKSRLEEDEVFEVILEKVPRSKVTSEFKRKMKAAQALPKGAWHRM